MFSPQDPLLRPSPVSHSNHLQQLDTLLPDDIRQLTKLAEECKVGNGQARALQEALLLESRHSKKSEVDKVSSTRCLISSRVDRSLADQLYASCNRALEELESQMSWANAQAEKSRSERGLSTPADFGISFEDQLDEHRTDAKSGNDDLPLAERAFGDLLAASDALTNVRQPRFSDSEVVLSISAYRPSSFMRMRNARRARIWSSDMRKRRAKLIPEWHAR